MEELDIHKDIRTKRTRFESKILLVELDELSGQIPIGTPFVLGSIQVPCLKSFLNDALIQFAGNYKAPAMVHHMKYIYESLTGKEIDVIELQDSSWIQLLTLLNELAEKIPSGAEVVFLNEPVKCFRSIISIVKEGLTFYPNDEYWKGAVAEIYKIMVNNGHSQFLNRY